MARNFNATLQVITASTLVSNATNNFSFNIWLNPNSTTGTQYLVFNGISAHGWAVTSSENDGKIHVITSGIVDITTTVVPSLNTWSNLVVSVSTGAAWTVYLNGTATSVGGIGAPNAPQTSTTFGNFGSATTFFKGSLADAAIWNTALTAGEASALSQGARPNKIRPASLQVWYPLDGLQSPEPDLSGLARNGTITGSVSLAFGPPFAPLTPRWPIYAPFRIPPAAAASPFLAARAMRANQVYTGYATQ